MVDVSGGCGGRLRLCLGSLTSRNEMRSKAFYNQGRNPMRVSLRKPGARWGRTTRLPSLDNLLDQVAREVVGGDGKSGQL